MWIDCAGRGGPTTVLISGLWGTHADWKAQIGSWRTHGRVCVYDRPGVGFSPGRAGTKRVDAGLHAVELRALLRAAGERGPFLLVGHSYGGLVARSVLRQTPALVAGLELLDAVPPGIQALYAGYGHTRDEGGAVIDIDVSSAATAYQAPLPGLPLAVVSAGHPITWAPGWVAGLWTREQNKAAHGSANSLRLVALDGLHQLQVYAPVVTLRSVETLRTAVRRHLPLPRCPGSWAAIRAQCLPR